MKKDNNYSVEPVWDENDDLAEMMDAMLRAPGLRNACLSDPDCNWAMFIGDKDVEEGITSLPPLEQEILIIIIQNNKLNSNSTTYVCALIVSRINGNSRYQKT